MDFEIKGREFIDDKDGWTDKESDVRIRDREYSIPE